MPAPPFISLGAALASEQDRLLGDRRIRDVDLLPTRSRARPGAIPRRTQLMLFVLGLFIATTTALLVIAWKVPTVHYSTMGSSPPGLTHDALGRWFAASASEPTVLRFSDGSEAKAASGSRFRVVELSRRGATLTLESGTFELRVAGSQLSEYLIGAGPFALTLPRSRAEVSWDPMTSSLILLVKEGQPVLAGCQFGVGKSLPQATKLAVRCETH